jgi:hypothetical protein
MLRRRGIGLRRKKGVQRAAGPLAAGGVFVLFPGPGNEKGSLKGGACKFLVKEGIGKDNSDIATLVPKPASKAIIKLNIIKSYCYALPWPCLCRIGSVFW